MTEEKRALAAMTPARGVFVGDRAIVPRIVIDVAVLGIEAVMTFPGAAVAPVPALPRRPDVPGVRPSVGPEVRCLRRSATESSRRQCRREDQPFHGTEKNTPPGRWQITPDRLVKRRRRNFLKGPARRGKGYGGKGYGGPGAGKEYGLWRLAV
jgi:hypothetical protein